MIYDITIIMLLMLYAIILKTLQNHVFLHVYAYCPPEATQQNVAIGPPLLLKITQDGRKMAARWSKMAHDGSRWPEVAP